MGEAYNRPEMAPPYGGRWEPHQGGFPVAISTTVQPTLQISACRPWPVCLMTSGACGGEDGSRGEVTKRRHSGGGKAERREPQARSRGRARLAQRRRSSHHPVGGALHALVPRLYRCEVCQLRSSSAARGVKYLRTARCAISGEHQCFPHAIHRRPAPVRARGGLQARRAFLDAPKSASFTTPALSTRMFAP